MIKRLAVGLALVLALLAGTSNAYADLRQGDTGPEVTALQYTLKSHGYSLAVDGVFGPQTDRVVRSYQHSNGLTVDGIFGPVTGKSLESADNNFASAVRARGPAQTPVSEGLQNKPFAPSDLSGCDEMNFYRVQWGLPDRFAGLGWRESNCRNEDGVRTWCCYGYWQNYISSHLRAPGYAYRIKTECQVDGADDINSDIPIEKQKQACVTAVVWQVSGYGPWS